MEDEQAEKERLGIESHATSVAVRHPRRRAWAILVLALTADAVLMILPFLAPR